MKGCVITCSVKMGAPAMPGQLTVTCAYVPWEQRGPNVKKVRVPPIG